MTFSSMLSIVIPAYNEEKTIVKCLDSLVNQHTSQQFEVIVVNNASCDDTEKVARSFKNQLNLRIIFEKKKGRGAARSAGFKAAKGEIIFSTDADAIVFPEWVETLIRHFKQKDIIAVSGTCRIDDCSWIKNTLFNIIQPMAMVGYQLLFNHFWLSGCNFAIRKDAYRKSGGFNPNLNALEDIDLSFRVKDTGTIKFIPNAPVTFSGRRLKREFWKGLFSYLAIFWDYYVLKKEKVVLSDIR